MADDQDYSQKTEEPTSKRLEEARSKGNVASSRELSTWFMLAAATLIVWVMAPTMSRDLSLAMVQFLELPHDLDAAALTSLGSGLFRELGRVLLLPTALLVAAALAAGLVQHGFLLAPERIQPDLQRISPLAGLKRLFSLRALADLVKGLLKIALVAALSVAVVWPTLGLFDLMPQQSLSMLVGGLYDVSVRYLGAVTAALAVVAGADFLFQRFEHVRKLRMSRQEVRDEHKQTEGDPHVRARLRAIRMERARRRMMQAVPEAAVVITNPTHFAVALAYEAPNMAAPKVVAKGADLIAARIREVAERHGVPIVENPPLARALYGGVELGDQIPVEHYQAVAQIIAYVYKLKGRKLPAASR